MRATYVEDLYTSGSVQAPADCKCLIYMDKVALACPLLNLIHIAEIHILPRVVLMSIQVKRFAAALIFGAFAVNAAQAQSTWTYATFTEGSTNAGSFGNSFSSTIGTTKLTVTAYSTTGAGSTFAAANIGNYGTGSGFGVRNQIEGLAVASPQHSMDNYLQTDMLALNFTNATTSAAVAVVLTDLATGWHNTSTTTGLSCNGSQANCVDSDISLLRWGGTVAPTITGGTIANLLTAGWKLVNNYADMVDDVSRTTGLATTSANSSSWWLISAYNSAWGTGTNTANLSNGDDFVKVLSSVSATPTSGGGQGAPEPGSLALAAMALFGLGAARRVKIS
jgi:hypothetical protein